MLKSIIFNEANKYEKETGNLNRYNWQSEILKYKTSITNNAEDIYFAHFSDHDLGTTNPYNRWGTPTGFYGYPMYDETHINYGSERKNIIIFKVRGNILDIAKYTETELDKDINKLEKYFNDTIENMLGAITYSNLKFEDPYFKTLWNITYYLSNNLNTFDVIEIENYNKEYKPRSNTWAFLLREIPTYLILALV
jgi:hypothetical protein